MSAELQIYSVYMHLQHARHQSEPKAHRGRKNKQQLAEGAARAKSQACVVKQLEDLCAAVKSLWSDAHDPELLQLGLPILRYALWAIQPKADRASMKHDY